MPQPLPRLFLIRHGFTGRTGLPLNVLALICALCINAYSATTQPAQAVSDIAPTEGMWLPNALPVDRLESQFNFQPSPRWVDSLRLSSVHFSASGAFVSADGLVLTNHHVVASGLEDISGPGKDYVADGFLARTRDQEIRLPGRELDVLISIEDVTDRVNAAVDPKLPPDQAVKARHAIFADIERESLKQTGLQSDVVTLYGGALYHLYRYKRYSDIRIVFAPEAAEAYFGGDPDNFEYPRFCLDIALVRAYENGKPAHVENYLRLSRQGPGDGDLVFVSGHPGRTDRLLTVSELAGMRDFTLPMRLEYMERNERTLLDYAARGQEQHREAQEEIFGIQNGLKATRPRVAALKGGIVEEKQKQEDSLRAKLRERADLRGFDDAWVRVAAAEQLRAKLYVRYTLLEQGVAFRSNLFEDARELVRLPAEDAKPDDARLPEYTQSKREELEQDLFADYPIYPQMEIAKLTTSLQYMRDKLGDDPIVQKILQGKEPAERAAELVKGSKLGSAAERKRVRDGGAAEIASSADTMIGLARLVDDDSRAVRLESEAGVTEVETQAMSDINRARFALLGTDDYPDATGTLRLAFGFVKGYEQNGGQIPPWTTFGGAFAHEQEHGATEPFKLPASWSRARDRLDPRTPLDFVCTADITNGNSGSPVVNRAGELVGVIFDSNRQGVANNFAYSNDQARAVAVDSRAILYALSQIYGADALARELTGTQSP